MHPIIEVSAGGFSAALTQSFEIILWGSGEFGTFRNTQKVCIDGVSFQKVHVSKFSEKSFIAAIDDRNLLYTWGCNKSGQLGHGDNDPRSLPTQVLQLKRKQVKSVALGYDFVIALGRDISLEEKRQK